MRWLHSATGQLTLGQLLARYPLLGIVVITNRGWRWLCRCCWWNESWLLLLLAAAGCWCWSLLLITAADCWMIAGCCWNTVCWLLRLVAGQSLLRGYRCWLLLEYCLLDDCWLLLEYCLLDDCWLLPECCLLDDCWLLLEYCLLARILWIFSGYWWEEAGREFRLGEVG